MVFRGWWKVFQQVWLAVTVGFRGWGWFSGIGGGFSAGVVGGDGG